MPRNRHDLIIIGGGLSGGLTALALARERPELNVALIEAGPAIGGNHLWSFFERDIDAADEPTLKPLIGHRWPGYEVRFPAHRRHLDQSYCTIQSERLDEAVRAALPTDAIIRARVSGSSSISVTLDDGRSLLAGAVLDTRGLAPPPATTSATTPSPPAGLACGWQKFCGQTLTIPAGHGLTRPIVMDATVDQSDGYRFVYCLPFSPTELFVEDTYYSDTPDLDPAELAERIAAYATAQGWTVTAVARQESGVLPVVIGGDFDAFWPAGDRVARGGVRAGLFHPLTSYSLPDAVRFAGWLARDAPLDASLGVAARSYAAAHWRRGRFDRLLGRMLFRAADPPQRYRILERFYRLPGPLVGRFYAGRSTTTDRFRILAGNPPVALGRAITAIMEKL